MNTVKKAVQQSTATKPKTTTGPTPRNNGIDTIKDVQKLIHMLQVYQIELEHQNQELRITEEELEISRNKYVNLFDFSPIPYVATDADGKITDVNLSAGKLFGMDRSKLIGKRFVAYLFPQDVDVFNAFRKDVIDSLVKQSCKLKMMGKDKRILHVLLEGIRIDDIPESHQRCQIAIIDLTEYQTLEDSFQKVSEELKLLQKTVKIQS